MTTEPTQPALEAEAFLVPEASLTAERLDGDQQLVIDLRGGDPVVVLPRPVSPTARFLTYDRGLLAATRSQLAVKRTIDIVFSILFLVVTAPVMLIAAIATSINSKGPVIFRQKRVGQDGQIFELLKFRTMYEDAEQQRAELEEVNEADGPVFKIRSDPRVTPVGYYMRKWSIDELPQLFQVLAGEMSLVGPRPPLPSEVDTYNDWERQRLAVKPGLTCIWQVSGRSEIDFSTWVEMDIDYICEWTLKLDLILLAKTIPAVFSGRGAY